MKVGIDAVLLGAWATVVGARTALDIGTGTAVLPLMLAQRNPDLLLDAVEMDETAAQQASENVQNSPWLNRIHIFPTAIQTFAQKATKTYDLIISNPPFWDEQMGAASPNAQRQQARHTAALTHKDLLGCVQKLLAENGRFTLILPKKQEASFVLLAAKQKLYPAHLVNVYPKPGKPAHRILLELVREKRPYTPTHLTIETEHHHQYTDEFASLTEAFYLKRMKDEG